MALKYDGAVTVAVGSSRRSVKWQNKELLWSELVQRLGIPTRTQESSAEYKALPKSSRDELKDVGGFVGGTLKGGRRKADAVNMRRLLTLDLDEVPKDADPWSIVVLVLGCAAVIYSTHSHSPEAPRLRLVLPLSRPVTPDEYSAIARRVAGDIGIDMCDDTTYEPHRLMYWPSASYDAEYIYEVQDAPWLDADEQLMRYTDWHDQSEWPVSSRKSEIMRRLAKTQGDPTEKKGVVGAFCRTYDVEGAIETFLPDVYTRCQDGRYTFTGGSTSGGLVLYNNGEFAYSHHATDPAGGRLCNAFDLVRLHLFGDQDDAAAPGTPTSRLPSYKLMADLAVEDENVRQDLAETRLREVSEAFDEDVDTDWLKELEMSSRGGIESTIKNAFIIMTHDPSLKDSFYFDEFRRLPMVCGDLPWRPFALRNTNTWADSDDAGLRMVLENRYQLDSMVKIRDAVDLAMVEKTRHPVREYLERLEWDGVPRIDTLLIDYLSAEDSDYTREVTRRALIGAVARIMRPGCKHDHVLVLVGPQGCGKSTLLSALGRDWFSDSLYTLSGKDAFEQIQGVWIVELGEMAAMRKAEVEQMKLFISKQEDQYRAAYGRRMETHPRQCAFFGSTNDEDFLRDQTGSRRFWPVAVGTAPEGRSLTSETVDQVWAEAVAAYKAGETWHLNREMEQTAREVQTEYTEGSEAVASIAEFLLRPIPMDWDDWGIEKRKLFWAGNFEDPADLVQREYVSALEVWTELYNGDLKTFTLGKNRELNALLGRVPWLAKVSHVRGGPYGRPRGFKIKTLMLLEKRMKNEWSE